MAKHRKYDLLAVIQQSIFECGWECFFAADPSDHPFSLIIYQKDIYIKTNIYTWNLTHGGGPARPQNEYRIQITGVDRFEKKEGEITLILGWWKERGVFAGFDYEKHSGKLGASPSFQIREDCLNAAVTNGFAPCDKGNGEIAIAFTPDFLVFYIQNLENLHSFGESQDDFAIFDTISNTEKIPENTLKVVSPERQMVVVQINKKLRETNFRNRVLAAYSQTCAFSGTQLRLVEAAHILPVSHPESVDLTSNGIALSALYHRAYDRGLVTFDENYKIIINHKIFDNLREFDLYGGADSFIQNLRPRISIPSNTSHRPDPAFIQKANVIRGWDKYNFY